MQVTQVEPLDNARSKIFLDGELAFVLYKGELRKYHIEDGAEMTQEIYDIILREILVKRARLRAMNLLQKREYTVSQLRTKLEQGMYPERIVEDALEYVAQFHYTDDLRYAVQYMMMHESSRSRRRIEQDLLGKGVSEDIICQAWQAWEEQGGEQDEEQMIRRLLEKRKFDAENADYKEYSKQAAFLMRKGFSAEKIHKVLRILTSTT